MTRIYLVRHCEALGNVQRVFQGTSDFDITDLGEKQLEALKNRFADIKLDRVLSSPLIRTKKTARAIIGSKNLPLETDNGLIELDGGIVEGKPFDETFRAYPELADTWINHPEDFAPENGEPIRDAYERIWKVIKRIASDNKNKTVALSTHGGVTRCLICRLLNDDIKQLKNIPFMGNTAVTLIEFDEDLKPELIFFNDTSHLTTELINTASNVVTTIEE